jgi:hypothetical protein
LARDENPLPTPAAEPAAATAAAAADCRPAHTPTNIPFHDHKPYPSSVVSQTFETKIAVICSCNKDFHIKPQDIERLQIKIPLYSITALS